AKLRELSIPAGEVRTVSEAFASAEAQARDAVLAAPHPRLRQVRMVRSPLRMSASPAAAPLAPPLLGQPTREAVRDVLGYPGEGIGELEQEGAIWCEDEAAG